MRSTGSAAAKAASASASAIAEKLALLDTGTSFESASAEQRAADLLELERDFLNVRPQSEQLVRADSATSVLRLSFKRLLTARGVAERVPPRSRLDL